jgi:ATP-dependent Clp protease ATP-binding subunit ClpC
MAGDHAMSESHPDNVRNSMLANPLQAIGVIFMLIMMVIMLNQLSVWFAPVLFLLSMGGMVVVAVSRIRAERIREEGQRSVDYHKLAAIDTDQILPWLKDNVRGHDQIIEAIFHSLKKNMQLARPGRTLGNFLLVGPTGTGKTFLSQLVGSGLFPKSELVLLTMNQYKQPGDVFTLIGPPPGMPGYEVGGRLTRPVLENPYRVIVLDELEKAHHDLHDCLYDILDTASCREKSSGRMVDFSGCVFFATCNAGVDKLRALNEEIGSSSNSAWLGRSRDALADAAKFDRAFLSRWDGVYLLDQLQPIHVAEVACLQLCRYWREYGIEVGYTDPELILDAVKRNQDFAEYGVRQLGRFIREKTETAIIQAKRSGATKVSLRVGSRSGDLEIEVPR